MLHYEWHRGLAAAGNILRPQVWVNGDRRTQVSLAPHVLAIERKLKR